MARTYTTDLTHFLDENGQVPIGLPIEAQNMFNYLAAIVDAATKAYPFMTQRIEVEQKCLNKKCKGLIVCNIFNTTEPIRWFCLDCGNEGSISGWQGSNWDNAKNK